MKKMTAKEFLEGVQVLKENEWYWTFDNDYSHKYKMLAMTDPNNITKASWQYVCSVMDFMLQANQRMFVK